MKYYTNVFVYKGKIYARGIHNGQQYQEVVKYKPYLFTSSKKPNAEYQTTIDELPADRIDFDSIWEAKEFLKEYKDVSGFPIYGLTKWQYLYIFDEFKDEIKFNSSDISVVSLDIEWRIGNTDIATAIATTPTPITAITISRNGYKDVFGCGDYKPHQDNITYHKCKNEEELLETFLTVWTSSRYNPDIITGWNTEGADIPYLVGRITKILGEAEAARMSPWGIIEPYTITVKGREMSSWHLKGISHLDYIELYRKFVLKPRESYRLDYIAEVELGEKKLDYTSQGYINLNDLEDRNFQLYIEYNIRDTELVDRLESKLKLIELVMTTSYDAGILYNDTLGTVNQWDIILHKYLLNRKIVVPPQTRKAFSDFVGGYVKDPIVGLYKWVCSFDLDSLYPSLFRTFNISPDTFVKRLSSFPSIDELLNKVPINTEGYSATANGCLFRKDKQGFIPAVVETMYADRKKFKGLMLDAEREYEKTKDDSLVFEISRLHNIQHSKKIQLNALYGASGNVNFRFFDVNIAEGITTSGQLVIRWISERVNKLLNKLLKTDNIDLNVYNDTDSGYFVLDDIVRLKFKDDSDPVKITRWLDKLCEEIIKPTIDKAIEELVEYMNAYENAMGMKREAIAQTMVITGAKKYALNVWNSEGIEYSEPHLKIVGLEAIRSSTPAACRTYIKNGLNLIMKGEEKLLQRYVEEIKEDFKNLPAEEIAFPRGVSNISKYTSGEKYKSLPIHVRGSISYNNQLKKYKLAGKYENIGNGDKIKFCYLKVPNPTQENVISFVDEFPLEFKLDSYIDYDLQFEKAFMSPMRIITNAIGWELEEIATLEGFFG